MQKLFKSIVPKGKRGLVYQTEFKDRVVEATFSPGASVKLIARQNNIATSTVYKWRLKHSAKGGLPGTQALVPDDCNGVTSGNKSANLLAIQVVDEPPLQSNTGSTEQREDLCEVDFGRACLRLRGDVSPSMLRLLIQELSR